MSKLTPRDLDIIGRARDLADAHGTDELRKVSGSKSDDSAMVTAEALGVAQYLLIELANLAERMEAKQ
jgi:hypothetical protein